MVRKFHMLTVKLMTPRAVLLVFRSKINHLSTNDLNDFELVHLDTEITNFSKNDEINNPSKVHTITDAYEVALQLGSVFIKREHVSMNSAVFGRLDFPSEICFVSHERSGPANCQNKRLANFQVNGHFLNLAIHGFRFW